MLTQRHKGEEYNFVFPLRCKEEWDFGHTQKTVASFCMMTDGVLDKVVGTDLFQNRVFYPFFRPCMAIARKTEEENNRCKESFEAYLQSTEYRMQVKDDITFLNVQNSQIVEILPEIFFSIEEWDGETERINEQTNSILQKQSYEMQRDINRMWKKNKRITKPTSDVMAKIQTASNAVVSSLRHNDQTGKKSMIEIYDETTQTNDQNIEFKKNPMATSEDAKSASEAEDQDLLKQTDDSNLKPDLQ